MSLWFLVVGLSFFTNPTGLLRFPAHPHHICPGGGGCLLYNVNMYNPTHFTLEDRESTQIQVLWDMMPLQLLNKNHTQSTFLLQIRNPALSKKCQNPNTNQHSFFFFFFAVSPFSSLAGSPHPCDASYQIALPVTMQLVNHTKVLTKFNTR
jgi:hypothetical protein